MGRNCSGANDIRQQGDYYIGTVDPLFYGFEDYSVDRSGKSLNARIMNCIGSLLFHINSYHSSLK